MVKVIGPLFPEGVGCLKYKPQIKDAHTYVVSVKKDQQKASKQKVVNLG